MSVEQTQVIDFISTHPVAGLTTLTVSDHLEWGDGQHLILLQEKLNAYLAFAESGEIFERYPNTKGKQVRLDVVCKYESDDEAIRFFSLCGETIKNAGFGFGYHVHKIQQVAPTDHPTATQWAGG